MELKTYDFSNRFICKLHYLLIFKSKVLSFNVVTDHFRTFGSFQNADTLLCCSLRVLVYQWERKNWRDSKNTDRARGATEVFGAGNLRVCNRSFEMGHETEEDTQERGLTRTRPTDHTDMLTRLYFEGNATQRKVLFFIPFHNRFCLLDRHRRRRIHEIDIFEHNATRLGPRDVNLRTVWQLGL